MDKEWEEDFWQGAKVLPLGGKYYGTGVDVGHTAIRVWDHSYYGTPSRRQLDDYGHEGKEWDDLAPQEKLDLTCDSHYETQADYDLALKIAALPDLISALDDLIDEATFIHRYSHGKIVESLRACLGESIERARKAMAKAYGEDDWLRARRRGEK